MSALVDPTTELAIVMLPGVMPAICADLCISRNELARLLEVAGTTAWRIEHRHVEPSPRFIAKLMAFTGRSFEELFEVIGQDGVR